MRSLDRGMNDVDAKHLSFRRKHDCFDPIPRSFQTKTISRCAIKTCVHSYNDKEGAEKMCVGAKSNYGRSNNNSFAFDVDRVFEECLC